MVSVSGDYVDLVKLGFGTSYFTTNNKEKVKIYQAAGMDVYLGGTLFEACYVRGKLDEYLKFIDDLGINTLEVSDGSIVLPHDEKLELISTLAKNYKVLSEVGSKEEGILIAPAKWISMMQTELEAGSWKVIAEARESGNVGIYRPNGSAHTMLVNKILAKVDGDKILWEAPKKPQQVWFIKLLGHNVNLGNIAPNDVIPLETLRAGLRGDTFFSWLPEDIVNLRAPK
jgi:phosphosulfolactate synthase